MALALRPQPPDAPPLGALLRTWRRRRNYSQLALALAADVSQRHLSFVESGRTRPSRDMVLRLAAQLEVPLRERNRLLLAAGFAPVYPERPLDDPALGAARAAVERVLAAHEPYPALAVDRSWTLVAANRAVALLTAGAAPALLAPPVNVLRLSLHPDGVAPRIVNYGEWRAHVLARLRREAAAAGDDALAALADELGAYPPPRPAPRAPSAGRGAGDADGAGVFVPLRLAAGDAVLSLLSTTTVFGTPADVTLAELALECFFPADAATAEWLRRAAAGAPGGG
jgi:transcriptional regulator with XRE-family HTH domain